jgi:N-methylhydantoinase A
MANGVLRVGVDTGGTFTDFIAWSGKTLWLLKVPSTPDAPERAVLNGLAALLRESPLTPSLSGSGGIPCEPPFILLHGTTVGTNAILEQRGHGSLF